MMYEVTVCRKYFVIIMDNFEALSTIERQVQIKLVRTLLLFRTSIVVISQSGLGMVEDG